MANGHERAVAAEHSFDVGGIRLRQPFKIRRLGHFGFNVVDIEPNLKFYHDLLGFRISDTIDFGARLSPEARATDPGPGLGYFLRHAGDHHSFVLFPKRVLNLVMPERTGGGAITINQITWQVGSLREVVDAVAWLKDRGAQVTRSGRDTPGSNWHVYPLDPDSNTNELFYGIEQIGWDGRSKPASMYVRGFRETPSLPQIAETQEVADALAAGIDLGSGYADESLGDARFDVGGVLLPRPFRITRIGPVRLFVSDIAAATAFYQEVLGLVVSERVSWHGHDCVFLRAGTEHHSLALYPIALREELGLSAHTSCLSFGLEIATYSQLRAAIGFLRERGVAIRTLPQALFPGVEHNAFAFDPDGHALQLYHHMEQIGWDGRPMSAERRRPVDADPDAWPQTLEPAPDSYCGEPFLGPWG